ncbi:E3 ubiquitin-protein ligase RING [Trema orientale]|uniref:E3 ubiquitin-protein ligase RING n=1 Tax=Trema orientale TaxID=63057 RepID=A0A2P5F097_TREOI|nr:E3 ubiquitin-protein ligase RING [Trema orientale]
MSPAVNLSDDGNGGGEDSNSGAAAEPNKLSCEICKRTVVLGQSDSSPEPSCAHCRNNQGSLKEQEPEAVQESSSSSSTAIINPLSPGILDAAFRHFRSTDPSPDRFNPFLFLQRYLRRLYGDGVRVIDAEIVIEDDGQGLETPLGQLHYQHFLQLIQQISVEEDYDLPRPTPASKSAVEELPAIAASEELSNVCVRRNTCPECRYELAKEDDESNVELYIVNSVGFSMWLDIRFPQEEDDHHDLAPENENPIGVDLERYERSPSKPYIRLSSNTVFRRRWESRWSFWRLSRGSRWASTSSQLISMGFDKISTDFDGWLSMGTLRVSLTAFDYDFDDDLD